MGANINFVIDLFDISLTFWLLLGVLLADSLAGWLASIRKNMFDIHDVLEIMTYLLIAMKLGESLRCTTLIAFIIKCF